MDKQMQEEAASNIAESQEIALSRQVPELSGNRLENALHRIRDKRVRVALFCVLGLGSAIILYALAPLWSASTAFVAWQPLSDYLNKDLLLYILCGFAAQLVDGALGLGYGLTCTTAMLAMGAPPVMVSSSIHTAEVFTTGVSGYAHYRFGNVNKRLVKALVWPGIAGAVAGALLLLFIGSRYATLTSLILGVYCFFLGAKILLKAIAKPVEKKRVRRLHALAAAGGFFDSFGGGGWGPLVASTLISKGRSPRFVVGSVSLAEFFITLTAAITFFSFLGLSYLNVVAGLIIGGTAAAPLAAKLAGKMPRRIGLILVGALVMIWSIYLIVRKLPQVL